MYRLRGLALSPDEGFIPAELSVEEDTITGLQKCKLEELSPKERERYLLPGLIDLHFHGCAGYDFCEGTMEAFRAIEAYEVSCGITSICPATMTLPIERLAEICRAAGQSHLTHLRGINLEGPFLSMEKRGAQNPAYITKPDMSALRNLQECSGGLIRLVAIAPEAEGALQCITEGAGEFRFSVAHTAADYATAARAFELGARQVTHLFNAMTPFSHREPGVIGAAAESDNVMAELITDGIHVHPSAVRAAFGLFTDERIILISDSLAACGLEDGECMLGGQRVTVRGKRATLSDGTIAGSVTNLFDCMKTAISMGIPAESAVKCASLNPARALGIANRYGSLEVGKAADILITDRDFELLSVITDGVDAPQLP